MRGEWRHDYVGIAFEEKGRERPGLDCWGLVSLIYRDQLGIELPSYLECYETTNDRDVLAQVIGAESCQKWEEVKPGQEKEFDVIILNMRGVPMHVGVVVRPGYMLHCSRGVGVSFEQYRSMRWANKVQGFSRHASLSS